jgi:phage/plasmid-like protein (TIGR03299 family)
MSHQVETMAYAGEVPWHGLGVKVNDDLTVDEMIAAAGLDWTVSKQPTFYRIGDEEISTGKFALIRDTDKKFLSNVSDGWEPCQNRDAFSIFEEFVERNELEMHTAGSLKDGQVTWGLAKMKDQFALFNDDVTEQYLLLVNPHVFGQGIHVRSTPIRVVCNNTLSFALGKASEVTATQNHRAAFDAERMKEAIGLTRKKLQQYETMASFLASKRYNEEKFKEYLNVVFPNFSKKEEKQKELSRNAKRAFEIVETQPGAEFGKGTWWQAFNSVTYLTDHELGRNADTRLQSAWLGINKDRKNMALEKAVEFAEAA